MFVFFRPEALSDSEFEEEEEVELPQTLNERGLNKGQQTKIRYVIIGQRDNMKIPLVFTTRENVPGLITMLTSFSD